MLLDDLLLGDTDALIAAGGPVLAATASAGAQLRAGVADADLDAIAAVAAQGRPRALVVMGAGGSSAAGDIVSACAGRGSATPVVTTGGPGLPGWVGPLDLVVAVSASGASPETLEVVAEAARRGASLVAVAPGGALADAVLAARGIHLGLGRVGGPRLARTLTWRLAAPLLLLAQHLGVVEGDRAVLEAAADELDAVSIACGPAVDPGQNPAKDLALAAAEGLALFWGTPGVPAAAARRAARQFAENAAAPALSGSLPEVARTHARILAGKWGGGENDIFRDRVAEPEEASRPHLVLLRDDFCDELSASLAGAAAAVAADSGIAVTELTGGAGHPLLRYARLSQPVDLASVYAAVLLGADPAGTAAGLHPGLGAPTAQQL